jgi:hypothetical protein
VKRLREKAERKTKRELDVSLNGHETAAKRGVPVQEQTQIRADTDSEQKKASAARSGAPVQVVSPFEAALSETALKIHERHPQIRRCGLKEIVDKLRIIVKPLSSEERLEKLVQIDDVHAQWCQSEQWRKDGGEFAKGLDNWLAPSKGRWTMEPPERVRKLSKSEQSLSDASMMFSLMHPEYK